MSLSPEIKHVKRIASALVSSLMLVCTLASAAPYEDVAYDAQCDLGRELKLPLHQWHSATGPVKGVILAIPGLVFTGRAYDSMARHLCKNGFSVYSLDLRGYGDWKSSDNLDGDSLVHYSQSKEDITRVLTRLRREYPNKQIFCMGESFGANYAVWEASTVPHLLDGVIACGLSYKIVMNPRPRWILTFFQGLAHPKKPMDLKPYLEPILSEDKVSTKKRLSERDTATQLSATDLIKAAITTKWAIKEIANIPPSMPILIIAGENDHIQKTNRLPEMISIMGSKQVELCVLGGSGHLLLERKDLDSRLKDQIDNWLNQRLPRNVISDSAAESQH